MPKRWLPVATLAIGVAVSIAVSLAFGRLETAKRASDFAVLASGYGAAIEEQLAFLLARLVSIRQLFAAVDEVSGTTFARFVGQFPDDGHVLSYQWVPRVTDAQRRERFPVRFAVPGSGGEHWLGLDLGAEAGHRRAIVLAMESGWATATAPSPLLSAAGQRKGVDIFVPHYGRGEPPASAEQRRERLAGFVLGALRLDRVMEDALARLPHGGIDVRLRDLEVAGEAGLMHVHWSRSRAAAAPADPDWFDTGPLRHRIEFAVANQRYELMLAAAPAYLSATGTRSAQISLIGGLMITAALAYIVALL
jgi:CHASE1-domain containing sensor protein